MNLSVGETVYFHNITTRDKGIGVVMADSATLPTPAGYVKLQVGLTATAYGPLPITKLVRESYCWRNRGKEVSP